MWSPEIYPENGRPGPAGGWWVFDLPRCVAPLRAGEVLASAMPPPSSVGPCLPLLLLPPTHPPVTPKGGEDSEGRGDVTEGDGIDGLWTRGARGQLISHLDMSILSGCRGVGPHPRLASSVWALELCGLVPPNTAQLEMEAVLQERSLVSALWAVPSQGLARPERPLCVSTLKKPT